MIFGAVFKSCGISSACCSIILALCLVASQGHTCEKPAAPSGDFTFPLNLAPGKRFLEDKTGRPFFMHGDTAWSLIAELTRDEADLYLSDRRARGFNAILVNLIEHRFATNAPANAYSDRPFLVDGDYSTPNEAYFKHADWVLRRACELGFLVLLTPSYAGNGGGPEGWYQEMVESGTQKLHGYGRFVGQRYASFENIVWVHGGDYNPPDKDLVRAIVDGIREVDANALHTAHGSPGSAALEHWRGEPWLSLNNVYTYEPVHASSLQQHLSETIPFFLLESAYENEHDAGEHRIRVQAYQAILSGAAGHLFGNNPIWHFSGPGIYPVETTWQEALGSRGARSMTVFHDLISSVKWWLLEPDSEARFVTAGGGGYKTRSVAAHAKDGSFALAYLPTGRGITLDLANLSGPWIAARWVDPSNGQFVAVEGSPFRVGTTHYFVPNSRNHAGLADWVLELTSKTDSSPGQ